MQFGIPPVLLEKVPMCGVGAGRVIFSSLIHRARLSDDVHSKGFMIIIPL